MVLILIHPLLFISQDFELPFILVSVDKRELDLYIGVPNTYEL